MDYRSLQRAADNIHKNSDKIGESLSNKYDVYIKQRDEIERIQRISRTDSLKKPCTL